MQSPLNYENPSFLQVHDIAALMFYYHITYGKSFLVAKSDKHIIHTKDIQLWTEGSAV